MRRAIYVFGRDGWLAARSEYGGPKGKDCFAAPGSIRCKYTGAYRRTVRFSPELQAAILLEALHLYRGGIE